MRIATQVDYQLWFREKAWTVDDACWLLAGYDPKSVPSDYRSNLDDDEREPRERLRRETQNMWRTDYQQPQDVRDAANEAARIKLLIVDATMRADDTPRPPTEWIDRARRHRILSPVILEALKSQRKNSNGKPERKTPEPFRLAFVRLLDEIEKRAGPDFDRQRMPGTKANLQAVAIKFDDALDGFTLMTFSDYISGLCRFKQGGRTSLFYAKLFPEFFV